MSREVRFFLVGERISSLFIEEKNFLFSCFSESDYRTATTIFSGFYLRIDSSELLPLNESNRTDTQLHEQIYRYKNIRPAAKKDRVNLRISKSFLPKKVMLLRVLAYQLRKQNSSTSVEQIHACKPPCFCRKTTRRQIFFTQDLSAKASE